MSHHMNPRCVFPASASTSGVFIKSLAAKKPLEDPATLHFRVSIWGQIRDCDTALRVNVRVERQISVVGRRSGRRL